MITRILELEKEFSANLYDGKQKDSTEDDSKNTKNFRFQQGAYPIIISAPHAVNHARCGQKLYADRLTGGMALYLAESMHVHAIVCCRYEDMAGDANYDEYTVNYYQQELVAYIQEKGIKVCIDLHGAARSRDFVIEIGTAPQVDVEIAMWQEEEKVVQIAERKLAEIGKICKDEHFTGGRQNTVIKAVRMCTYAAGMQLEIHAEYRDVQEKEKLRDMVLCLEEMIADILAVIEK
jgi:hypothetical protein